MAKRANCFNFLKLLLDVLVPITQRWREELKKFTEASGIKSKNPYTNTTSYQVPPSRNGSRQGERPPPSRGHELPNPFKNGEKPPSRQGEQNQGDSSSILRQGLSLQHITAESDADLTVSTVSKNTVCEDCFFFLPFFSSDR